MSDYIITDKDIRPNTGYIERDFNKYPVAYCSKPFCLDIIPRDQVNDILREKQEVGACLSDMRDLFGIEALNQGRTNYCWFYSSTAATMLTRANAGEPYVPLSGTSGACIIKRFRNQGGWCSQSLEFIAEHGVCELADWPQGIKGIDPKYNTEHNWEKAKRYRITEWMDLEPGNVDQLVTCLLHNIPVVTDFNWWGHSVCTMDLVAYNPRNPIGGLKTKILNSWANWGDRGTGILQGRKAIPNGAIAPLVTIGD